MARKSRKPEALEAMAITAPLSTPAFCAWIYARISNDSEKADDSIGNQIALCKQFICTHNNGNEFTFSGIFSDLGYSGTDFERPGYTEMLAGILSGEIKCIIVKEFSRP